MKRITLSILTLFLLTTSIAQNNLKDKSHYHDTYVPDAVINEKYVITMYEKLNIMLGGDTVRNDPSGYAANGYLEDYYTTGQLLHKGFYVDGLNLYYGFHCRCFGWCALLRNVWRRGWWPYF